MSSVSFSFDDIPTSRRPKIGLVSNGLLFTSSREARASHDAAIALTTVFNFCFYFFNLFFFNFFFRLSTFADIERGESVAADNPSGRQGNERTGSAATGGHSCYSQRGGRYGYSGCHRRAWLGSGASLSHSDGFRST